VCKIEKSETHGSLWLRKPLDLKWLDMEQNKAITSHQHVTVESCESLISITCDGWIMNEVSTCTNDV
jgi:hypothetical protein